MKKFRLVFEVFGYICAGVILLALLLTNFSGENAEAVKLGYDSATDRKAAVAAGVSDPTEWKTQKANTEAKAKAAEAEANEARRRQRIADEAEAAKKRIEDQRAQEESEKRHAAADKKKADDCRLDLQCWGEKGTISAGVYCKKYIEQLAKYQFKWNDAWYEQKFTRYKWSNKKDGIVTYIGDKIELQNGFGAFQNHIYTCDINPETKAVSDVSATPGRLPIN